MDKVVMAIPRHLRIKAYWDGKEDRPEKRRFSHSGAIPCEMLQEHKDRKKMYIEQEVTSRFGAILMDILTNEGDKHFLPVIRKDKRIFDREYGQEEVYIYELHLYELEAE